MAQVSPVQMRLVQACSDVAELHCWLHSLETRIENSQHIDEQLKQEKVDSHAFVFKLLRLSNLSDRYMHVQHSRMTESLSELNPEEVKVTWAGNVQFRKFIQKLSTTS